MDIESELEVGDLLDRQRTAVRAGMYAKITANQRRIRSRRIRLLVATSAVVTVGAIFYPSLSSPSAYASWTPIPTTAVISSTDPRIQGCIAEIPTDAPIDTIGQGRLTPVLAETRGAFTATLLGADDSIAICIFSKEDRSSGRTLAVPLPEDQVMSVLGNGGSLDGGQGARYVYGRSATSVTSITVMTSDSKSVTATVSNGYFLAWWPAGAEPREIKATDDSGRVLEHLKL